MRERLIILQGDWIEQLRTLPNASAQCCVTSPPYWGLRDYGVAGQLGLEKTPEEYVAKLVAGFREVRRVLREDGTLWLNLGDSYANSGMGGNPDESQFRKQATNAGSLIPGRKAPNGLKPKDLVGIPWRVAFALQADGWYLRSDIIWHKPNPMPESVTDRPTKAHEYIFLLTKNAKYFYDADAIKEPAQYGEEHARKSTSWGTNRKHPNKANVDDYAFIGDNHTCHVGENGEYQRNKRTVWTIATSPYREAHFATFPPSLIKPCIMAGTSSKGCCSSCGAPWERIVSRSPMEINRSSRGEDIFGNNHSTCSSGTMTKPQESKTIGWQPTCECNGVSESDGERYDAIPCTVIDPFGGSGTTGKVAIELGRNVILIELNPKYIPLIEKRTKVSPILQQHVFEL